MSTAVDTTPSCEELTASTHAAVEPSMFSVTTAVGNLPVDHRGRPGAFRDAR